VKRSSCHFGVLSGVVPKDGVLDGFTSPEGKGRFWWGDVLVLAGVFEYIGNTETYSTCV